MRHVYLCELIGVGIIVSYWGNLNGMLEEGLNKFGHLITIIL